MPSCNNVSRLVGLLWNVPNFDHLSRSDHFHLKGDVVEKSRFPNEAQSVRIKKDIFPVLFTESGSCEPRALRPAVY